MSDRAVAIKTIAVGLTFYIQHYIHGIFVAADAVFLHNISGNLARPDGGWNVAKTKRSYMMVTVFGFDEIFGDQVMRCVAVRAVGPVFMCAVIPAFVDRIHHMTVITGGWIIAQVGGEVGDVEAYSDHSYQSHQTEEENQLKVVHIVSCLFPASKKKNFLRLLSF